MRLFVLLLMLLCSSAFGITVVQPSSGSSSGGGSPTVADQGSNNVYTGSNVFSNGLKTTQVELLDPSSLGTVFSNALTSAVTSNNGFYTDNNTLTWFNATNSTYTVKWSGGSLSGELGWTNSASLQAGEYFARIRCVTSRGPGTIAGLSLRIVSAAGAVLASNGSSNNPIGQIISCGYTGTQARGVDILVSGSLGQSYSLDFNDFYLTNSAVYDIASPGRVEVLAPNGMTASGVTLQSGTVNAAQGAFSTSLTLGGSNVMTSAGGGGLTGLVLLARTTLTQETTSITFSPVDQTYKHLRVLLYGRSARVSGSKGDTLIMRFNGDSATNYPLVYFYVDSSAGAQMGGEFNETGVYIGNLPTVSTFPLSRGMCRADIFGYTDTSFWHQVSARGDMIGTNAAASGQSFLEMMTSTWKNPNAITDIVLRCLISNMTANTCAELWGIR